jgi:DNA-binding NtrC family response regulator
MRLLSANHWQGNVRELENAMERAVVFCQGQAITVGDLPFSRPSAAPPLPADAFDGARNGVGAGGALPEGLVDLPYRDAKNRAVSAFDTAYFTELLNRTGGNISEAARQAGLDRSNFRRAAKRAGVTTKDNES